MSKKPEPTEPFSLGDGDVYFFNPDGFRERFSAEAVMVREGVVYVLPEGSNEFTNINFIKRKSTDTVTPTKGRI